MPFTLAKQHQITEKELKTSTLISDNHPLASSFFDFKLDS